MHDDLFDHPMEAGALYAGYRLGQDQQTDDLLAGVATLVQERPPAATADTPTIDVHVHLADDDDPDQAVVVNAADYAAEPLPESWSDYIGQEKLKFKLQVAINSAAARGTRLPHMLFVSNMPGVGKSTIGRMVADQLGEELGRKVSFIELTPPFDNIYVLVKAAEQLLDGEILFIDEIHKLREKRRGDEILLKMLEDGVAYLPNGDVVQLNDITIIGATTEKDALIEPVLDRFSIEQLAPYSLPELTRIAVRFAWRFDSLDLVNDDLAIAMGQACRGMPREIRRMVEAARDLAYTLRRPVTADELFSYLDMESDGLIAPHRGYLTWLRTYGRRTSKEYGVEYMGGEATMITQLRETKAGIGRIERLLIDRGLLEKTPRGRRLTEAGIERAEDLIDAGKGV